MIIVSQDKKEIINFDRITEIVVSDKAITITDGIQQQMGYEIGMYATEKRAKEVLQGIVNHYYNYELTKVYEMPEE